MRKHNTREQNAHFLKFLAWHGGRAKHIAEALGVSTSYVYLLKSGIRPVTRNVAEACERVSEGKFKKHKMLWG